VCSSDLTAVRAGIYIRISRDPHDTRKGVARQLKDCKELGADLAWPVVPDAIFDENNVSATNGKPRTEYQRAQDWIRTKKINAIIFREFDRYSRDPMEAEDLLRFARSHGLRAASTSGGEMDLLSPKGRADTIKAGADARKETEQMAKRIRSAFDQKAAAGEPHGFVPFGWRRVREVDDRGNVVSSRDELHEPQAQLMREAGRRLLSGESLRSVTAWFNESGELTLRGNHWSSVQVRQLMLRDRNAGRRIHRGKDVGPAAWPPIYDDDTTHPRVKELLTAPDRRTQKGSTRKHLLTGLATCGRCHSTDIRVNAGTSRRAPGYTCQGCYLRRKQVDVDQVVEAVMVEWLTDPDALTQLASGDRDEVARAQAEIRACEAKLKLAADQFADSDDDDAIVVLTRVRERVGVRIKAAEDIMLANLPVAVPLDMAGPGAEAKWAEAPLDVKRELIRMAWTVIINPVPRESRFPGAPFDPSLIEVSSMLAAP